MSREPRGRRTYGVELPEHGSSESLVKHVPRLGRAYVGRVERDKLPLCTIAPQEDKESEEEEEGVALSLDGVLRSES